MLIFKVQLLRSLNQLAWVPILLWCRITRYGLGEEARQARLAVPVSMGHPRSNKTGATSLACLIRGN